MRHSLLTVTLISAVGLTACSSRMNPLNWFGGSREVPLEQTGEPSNPLIPNERSSSGIMGENPYDTYLGTPVLKVQDLKIEHAPGGAIISVVGIASVQQSHTVKLQPRNLGQAVKGVLTYDLLAVQNPRFPVGTEQTRVLRVAHALTDQQLEGVRTIKVIAKENARQARR